MATTMSSAPCRKESSLLGLGSPLPDVSPGLTRRPWHVQAGDSLSAEARPRPPMLTLIMCYRVSGKSQMLLSSCSSQRWPRPLHGAVCRSRTVGGCTPWHDATRGAPGARAGNRPEGTHCAGSRDLSSFQVRSQWMLGTSKDRGTLEPEVWQTCREIPRVPAHQCQPHTPMPAWYSLGDQSLQPNLEQTFPPTCGIPPVTKPAFDLTKYVSVCPGTGWQGTGGTSLPLSPAHRRQADIIFHTMPRGHRVDLK